MRICAAASRQAPNGIPGFDEKKRLFDPETRAATDEEVAPGFTDYQVRVEVLRWLNLKTEVDRRVAPAHRHVNLDPGLTEDHSIETQNVTRG